MSFRFQFRRGTTAERDASNPILAAGEPAVVLDSGQPAELVLGDGVTAMADLRAAVWDDDARLTLADTATQPGDLSTYAPERFGAVGDGVADDTLAVQTALDAAGSGGAVELRDAVYLITDTLDIPDGCEIRGTSRRGSVVRLSADIPAMRTIGGEGQQIRNLKIHNTFTGTRTTHDVLMVNPYHPIIANVEIALSQDSRQKGGVHLLHDVAQANPTQKNMPVLDNVFIRNGVLKVEDVGDVKVDGGWTWATYTEAPGAIELDRASNFIAVNHDIIPSVNAGYYISGGTSNFTIIGGLMDGNGDPSIHPGPAMKVAPGQFVRSLQMVGVKFWNLWQSALDLSDARAVTITGCEFRSNNREDANHHEINLTACRDVVVVGNTFSAVDARVNKGRVFVEDATSSNNLVTANTIEAGHNYASGIYTIQESSLVHGNVPVDSWPRTELLAKSSNYTVTKYDLLASKVLLTTAACTVTLASSTSVYAGSRVTIKAGATTTVATTSGQTIDGSSLPVELLTGESITVVADGGNWRTLSSQRAPKMVVPPLSVMALLGAATWGGANLAVFSRFTLGQPTSLRYANIRIDTASGNWQVAVVALSGAEMGSYSRVMSTGVQTMPTAGDKRVDLGQSLLPPGEYAVVVWCDNTTAQMRVATNSSVPVTRLAAEVSGLASGVPSTGTGLVWNSNRLLGSLTLEPNI